LLQSFLTLKFDPHRQANKRAIDDCSNWHRYCQSIGSIVADRNRHDDAQHEQFIAAMRKVSLATSTERVSVQEVMQHFPDCWTQLPIRIRGLTILLL